MSSLHDSGNLSSTAGSRPGHLAFDSSSLPLKGSTPKRSVKREDRVDIHNYAKRLQDALEIVSNSQITREDKEAIRLSLLGESPWPNICALA